jgi:acetyl-CoA acyltransferase
MAAPDILPPVGGNTETLILGVGMTPFGRHLDRTLADLAQEAADAALADAGISKDDVDAVVFANSFAGLLTGQESIRGEAALARAGFAGKAIVNVENACASGSTAVLAAVDALRAGRYDTVLAVGAEKLFHPDRKRSFQALESATDVSEERDVPEGHSVFMDHYARKALAYMERHGATQEDFAAIAVKSSAKAAHNPYAQHRKPHTLAGVLEAPPITDPLTLYMCSPISDGAAAVVLSRNGGSASARTPAVRGTGLVAGDGVSDPTPGAARLAFAEAGIEPGDADVAEVHDATAPSELFAIEELGLCGPGEGSAYLRAEGEPGIAAVNPSGGLLSRGHPVAATGVAQVAELTWQLRGDAGERQVAGADVAVSQNAGGVLGDDVAIACVTVVSSA